MIDFMNSLGVAAIGALGAIIGTIFSAFQPITNHYWQGYEQPAYK